MVGQAEHAVFHRAPAAALTAIDEAVLAAEGGSDASAERAVLAWLRGVAEAAMGDFGAALETLGALLPTSTENPRGRLVVAYAAAASASVHRQLGRFEDAATLDSHGFAAAEPLGDPGIEATLDCLVGLTSDALGVGDYQLAGERIAAIERRVTAVGDQVRWRPRCRLEWARAEAATATGNAVAAEAAAAAALRLAQDNDAPRHIAKSQLYAGMAALSAGDAPGAVAKLRESARLAGEIGALPLSWRSAALLGALTRGSDPAGAVQWLATARAEASRIAETLPAPLRASWLARPDVAAVLPSA